MRLALRRGSVLALMLAAGVVTPATAQRDAANSGTKLMADAVVKAAVDAIRVAEPQTIEDQIRWCEVEAPPFKEQKRAEVYARIFREAGLQNVRIDKVNAEESEPQITQITQISRSTKEH